MACRLYYLVDGCSHILGKHLDPRLKAQRILQMHRLFLLNTGDVL